MIINSRNIDDLDHEVKSVCIQHIALCHGEGIELIITSTYRDYEMQDFLFSQGRTTPGKIVTHARAGESYHNFKAAYDCVPLVNGKADWSIEDAPFQRMIDLGIQAGATAGYDWPEPKTDPDHFQYVPSGINTAEAKALFDANGTIFTAINI